MDKKSTLIYILVAIISLVFWILLYYALSIYLNEDNINDIQIDTSYHSAIVDTVISSVDTTPERYTYSGSLEIEEHMENLVYRIDEESDEIFFKDFYNWFKALNDYDAYKKYSKKYPELLPVLYAVREKDKQLYIKFYDFTFDKIYEQGEYIGDIENLVGEVKNKQELKKKFLEILGQHYDTVISGKFEFSTDFWDGPLHIALSNNSIEEALVFCDNSGISGINDDTKKECYDYVYQYRATKENALCEKLQSVYQKRVCKWFLQYK